MKRGMNKKSEASLRKTLTIHPIDIDNLRMNSNPTLNQISRVRAVT
jgi:hypothetical protein